MRGGISFLGAGEGFVAMKSTGLTSANVGAAVTLVGNETVGLGTADKPLIGKVQVYEADGIVSLQYKGFAEFAIDTVNPPVVGQPAVVDGTGKIKALPTTPTVDMMTNVVVSVDTVNGKAVVLLK